ncbi:MAG: Holliday junction DNA helicase RuvA [Actinobacteria bacterium 69-20]|nr:Holliday junction branch migration protein RuvA [Actinomycetota bacterium]OJV30970.1 MAG: Holliday junction DNA helicase RuvA [Actinobacteria bacterium 69-20]
MIASVRGTVAAIALDHAVIDVGGVGLAVRATPGTLSGLKRGEQANLATTLVVREDSLTLFGFATTDAKVLFELVQSVSGVGPKIALALLAVLEPDDLRRALAGGDTAVLMRTPGIGRKSAERLVLELKDKVGALAPVPGGAATSTPVNDRLIEALSGLGFTSKQAAEAVAGVTADASDEAVAAGDVGVLLRRALAVLGRNR